MKKWFKIFLFIFFLLVSISFFFAGAYAHKFGYIGIVKNIFRAIPNFVSGKIGKFNFNDIASNHLPKVVFPVPGRADIPIIFLS